MKRKNYVKIQKQCILMYNNVFTSGANHKCISEMDKQARKCFIGLDDS